MPSGEAGWDAGVKRPQLPLLLLLLLLLFLLLPKLLEESEGDEGQRSQEEEEGMAGCGVRRWRMRWWVKERGGLPRVSMSSCCWCTE